jgi:hypothetical protein
MKMILFASALALSTAAMAQDATPAQMPPSSDSSGSMAPQTTPDATAPAAGDQSMAPSSAMPADQSTAPSSTMPADQSTMPADQSAPSSAMPADQSMSGGAGSMSSAQQAAQSTDDSNLPMCSRTVTDKCKQGGSGMRHGTMRHHKRK